LRRVRAEHIGTRSLGYADLDFVRQEMTYAYQLFEQRKDWPLVDVTAKSIEEAAAEVVALIGGSHQAGERLSLD
jgi:regulator of PEP synthase PpsR (kinase-PPPase family)